MLFRKFRETDMTKGIKYNYILEKLSEELKQREDCQQNSLYLYAEERKRYEVEFTANGELRNHEGKVLNGEYIYVMSPGGKLYAALPSEVKHHSYFLAGEQVKCAGMIKIENGKLIQLSNESGHYKPDTDDLKRAAKSLLFEIGYQDFICVDHSCLAKKKSEIKEYPAKAFVTSINAETLTPSKRYTCFSRSNARGLSEHQSQVYKDAIKVIKEYESQESLPIYITDELYHLAKKVVSPIPHKSALSDFKQMKKDNLFNQTPKVTGVYLDSFDQAPY